MKSRSKSDLIRDLADKGLTKPEIVKKTGFSQQLVHNVYTLYKGRTPKPEVNNIAKAIALLNQAIKLLK